jgi:hypothetical protein
MAEDEDLNSFDRRGRPSSHTSANRFRTTRYTNDQSKQPPSTTARASNLARPATPGAADEFANPTRSGPAPHLARGEGLPSVIRCLASG